LELLRESKHWLPNRGLDENDLEDTDRLVLYDHLDGLLFQFQDQGQVFKIFVAFIAFLEAGHQVLNDDPYDLNYLGSQSFHEWIGLTHADIINQDDSEIGVLLKINTDIKQFKTFIQTCFSAAFKAFKEPFKTQIVLLWLKYETTLNLELEDFEDLSKAKKAKVKQIKAKTMAILAEDQNNTRIYIGYAQALAKLGDVKAAKKVTEMALKANKAICNLDALYLHSFGLEMQENGGNSTQWVESRANSITKKIHFFLNLLS
jgi:hypothetical protein